MILLKIVIYYKKVSKRNRTQKQKGGYVIPSKIVIYRKENIQNQTDTGTNRRLRDSIAN